MRQEVCGGVSLIVREPSGLRANRRASRWEGIGSPRMLPVVSHIRVARSEIGKTSRGIEDEMRKRAQEDSRREIGLTCETLTRSPH